MLAIFDTDNWSEIFDTLGRNKTRTFLTAFGIFWGTMILSLLLGGAGGLTGLMQRQFKDMATNSGVVYADVTSKSYKGYNKGMSWSMDFGDVERLQHISRGLEHMSPIINRYAPVAYGKRSKAATITGMGPDYFKIQIVNILAGRVLNDADEYDRRKNVVLGSNVSSELFGVDPQAAIGRDVCVNGQYYRVVGVVEQRGEASFVGRVDNMAMVPVSTMRLAFQTGNDIDMLLFTAKKGFKPRHVIADARRAVRAAHPIHPEDDKALQSFDASEIFDNIGMVFAGIDLLALFVGLGTLLAGVIGVGNIMWIIVRERTSEIGIRRAIGALPRQIIAQILSESTVLTMVAGLAGIVMSVVVLYVADKIAYDPMQGYAGFQLGFVQAVAIFVTFVILGTLAGIVPALKAMRIKPVEAMRIK